jgi:V/A-type H+-transporting ATPase subunit K
VSNTNHSESQVLKQRFKFKNYNISSQIKTGGNKLNQRKQNSRRILKQIARKRTFFISIVAAIVLPSLIAAVFSVQMTLGSTVTTTADQIPTEFYSQYGLGLVAAGLAVAGSCLGAGIAIYGAASAGAAAIAERPETSVWVLILAGLGEGVAIYGLLIAILILGKLPTV